MLFYAQVRYIAVRSGHTFLQDFLYRKSSPGFFLDFARGRPLNPAIGNGRTIPLRMRVLRLRDNFQGSGIYRNYLPATGSEQKK
jgi:hypothetical protein